MPPSFLELIHHSLKDESRPLWLEGEMFLTVNKSGNKQHMISSKGGCCLVNKNNITVLAIYDKEK